MKTTMYIKDKMIWFLVPFIAITCSSTKKFDKNNYYLKAITPYSVKIEENLFCDVNEVDNLNYREFVYWTKRIYGDTSYEYLSILPDERTWQNHYKCNSIDNVGSYYYSHPAFNTYAVVGITQKQANVYSEWRSNIFFQMILLKLNKIKIIIQDKESFFTIEKYYNGTYKGIISDEKLMYYPVFRLPTLIERDKIIKYSDSLNLSYLSNCKSEICKKCLSEYPCINSNISDPCDQNINTNQIIPIWENSKSSCSTQNSINNIRGNVREWVAEKNIAAGGSWLDSRENIMKSDTTLTENSNPWTGFRNVYEWKLWNK